MNNEALEYLQKIQYTLELIKQEVSTISENTKHVAETSIATNPAGEKSAKKTLERNLVKLYIDYLVENENYNKEEARLRATFELDEFGVSHLIREINDAEWWDNSGKSKEALLSSPMFNRELSKYLTDHSVEDAAFEAMFYLLHDQSTSDVDDFTINTALIEIANYTAFLEPHAVAKWLEKQEIIERISGKKWNDDPHWRTNITDLRALHDIIYKGERDDDWFNETVEELEGNIENGEQKEVFS